MRKQIVSSFIGVLVYFIAAASGQTSSHALAVATKLTLLGRADLSPMDHIYVSPNQSRVAWKKQVANGVAMVVDGVVGPQFSFVDDPIFSVDGAHVVYVARNDRQFALVIDGKPTPFYAEVHDAKFSDDSKHLLYVIRLNGNEEQLLLDGVRQGPGSYFYIKRPAFSPDGKTVVFDAMKERTTDKSVLVQNGVEGPVGGENTDFTFSADSQHLLAIRHDDLSSSVIIDGMVAYTSAGISSPIISGDGKHFFVELMQNNQCIAVIDGKPQKPIPSLQRFDFAPRGPRYVYIGFASLDISKGMSMTGVIDGKEFGPVARIAAPKFSPDGTRLAFRLTRTQNGPMTMWVDGVEQKPFADVDIAMFSPDSKRLAYGAKQNLTVLAGSSVMMLDGAPQTAYDAVYDPTFSPDSRRFAYRAHRSINGNHGDRIVLDGAEQATFDVIGTPVFSADSAHCAYLAHDKEKYFAVIDGKETQRLDPLPSTINSNPINLRPVFDANDRFHFLATNAGEIVRADVTIHAGK